MQRVRRIVWVGIYLALVAGFGAGVWWYAYRGAIDALAERARTDLALASDRLTAQALRSRELAVVLARHPDLQAALEGTGAPGTALEVVVGMADMTGTTEIDLVDTAGRIVVANTGRLRGRDPAAEPLARAVTGALGTASLIEPVPGGPAARVFAFAAPVFGPDGLVRGAVIVEANVRGIEDNWPGSAPAVFFTEAGGRVFASNRSDLVLADRGGGRGFPAYSMRMVGGHEVWSLEGGPYLPRRAVHQVLDLPVIGLTAEILMDARAAGRSAALQAMVAMALLLVFGGVLALIMQNRLALAERLAVEAEENARLEARVAERTRALSAANLSLTREVAERKEAEAALKRAQDELVQAGKLAALGKMSAGISHELNQPLMAIRSFAENAEQFFQRGRPEAARENLGRIAELARRMGRIIQNLRAFARQENGPISDVDLVAIVASALETGAGKIEGSGTRVIWEPPPGPVLVRGGEVRLEQVVLNLLSNAVDAMEGAAEKRLEIGLEEAGGMVRLTVRDTGPGIVEPERVFDPFYSTKKVGAAEGMGLGLSISYGLVQSFGGAIRGANHPAGGAVFAVELRPAGREAAA